MDIRYFLQKLSNYIQIDFTGKESEMALLAQKYDKNNNSIFEKEELQEIKDDLQRYANEDGNGDELNIPEAENFFKSLTNKMSATNFVQNTGENISEYTNNILKQLNYIGIENDKTGFIRSRLNAERTRDEKFVHSLESFSAEELDRISPLLNIENRENQFDSLDLKLLSQLSEKEIERAKKYLMNIENRKEQFDAYSISVLSKLNDDEFERAKNLFYVESRNDDEQFDCEAIKLLACLPYDKFEQAKQLFYVPERKNQFWGDDIAMLAELSNDELERAKQFFYVAKRNPQFSANDIVALVKLTDAELDNVKPMFNIEGREEQLQGWELCELAYLSEEELTRAKQLLYIDGREEQFRGDEIAALVKCDNKQFKKIKEMAYIKERGSDNFKYTSIEKLSTLSDEQFKRAKSLFYVEGRKTQFDGKDIVELLRLSDSELQEAKQFFNIETRLFDGQDIVSLTRLSAAKQERAKSLFNIEGRECQLDKPGIIALAQLSDDEFERIKKYVNNAENKILLFFGLNIAGLAKLDEEDAQWAVDFMGDQTTYIIDDVVQLAKNHNKDIENFITEHKNMILEYTADNSVKILIGDEYYTYEKDNLVESGHREKIEDTESMTHCYFTTLYNNKKNIKHEIYTGQPKYAIYGDDVVYKEFVYKLDDKGNIITTITLVRNPDNGVLNVSEISNEGIETPVQWESIDPDTGAAITERHLVSPEGTKTDYYAEESENLKITDYKITGRDGNELINVYQTFQQLSENKYISSINTTGKYEDTQIYEIEYTDNNIVKIFDKKNNNITKINLEKYMNSVYLDMEKLLPIIKNLPGQVLLEFAEKHFIMRYDKHIKNNGTWGPSSKELVVGDWKRSPDEEESMFATLVHELGHYLDLYGTVNSKFANNPHIVGIFKEEFELFKVNTTTAQQEYVSYFTNLQGDIRGNEEKVAETHSILYSNDHGDLNMRRLYLAQYFPRTMAAIMKLLLEEEGVSVP